MTTNQERQLDALGDPTRRAVLKLLRNGPMPVTDIARRFPISRPAISQHLRILKDARLVTDEASGTRRIYRLNPAEFASLQQFFQLFWTQSLQAFKEKVEDGSDH